jgi:tripartite-type tricarboxylate transporter receptor subunit TctC
MIALRAVPSRLWQLTTGLVGFVLVAAVPAQAETYPTRPVTIITPFAAGSQTDAAARLLGQYLQEALGQSFVIDNRAGAGGQLAASAVARAKPDGYTLLLTTNSTHSAIALFKSVPYDPIKDFTPIARLGNFPSFVAVNNNLPVNSMAELVAHAKAHPGQLSYGVGNSTGPGGRRDAEETHRRRHRAGLVPQQSCRHG